MKEKRTNQFMRLASLVLVLFLLCATAVTAYASETEPACYGYGDVNGDNAIDHNDAIHLLLNTMFGEAFYPLNAAPGDIDRNGTVDQDDAVYLLLYTMFGENFYPLN